MQCVKHVSQKAVQINEIVSHVKAVITFHLHFHIKNKNGKVIFIWHFQLKRKDIFKI